METPEDLVSPPLEEQQPGKVALDGVDDQSVAESAPPLEAVEHPDFARSEEERRAWERAKRLLSDSALAADMRATGALTALGQRIESGFAFREEEGDEDFSPLHVEPLLDQAADLLDRCLRDRASWDELASRMVTLQLELSEYAELDAIHLEEEAVGVYDVEGRQSRAEHAFELTTADWQALHAANVSRTITAYYFPDEANKRYNASRKAAWISGLVPYVWKGQSFDKYVQYTWGDRKFKVSELAVDAAEVLSNHALGTELRALALQRDVFTGLATASGVRGGGLRARAEWESANAAFRRRRTLVARRFQDLKTKLATEPDGLLNYGKRLNATKARFQQDFRDALARLLVVREGMRALYGYDAPLPDGSDPVNYYDECLIWTRRAIQWLIRFTRQEQSFVLPVSVRELVGGDQAWRAGRTRGVWEFDLVESTAFPLAHVRLRGLSALVRGDDSVLWHLDARVPRAGRIVHLGGPAPDLDQSRIPGVLLARAAGRDAVRAPDVVGVAALHNASPYGRWRVAVVGSMPPTGNAALGDIQIDLHLAFRRPLETGETPPEVPPHPAS